MADEASVWVHDEHMHLYHRYRTALADYERDSASTAPLAQRTIPASEMSREGSTLKQAVTEARAHLRAFEEEHVLTPLS